MADQPSRRERIRSSVNESFGAQPETPEDAVRKSNSVDRLVDEGTAGLLTRAMRAMNARKRKVDEALEELAE